MSRAAPGCIGAKQPMLTTANGKQLSGVGGLFGAVLRTEAATKAIHARDEVQEQFEVLKRDFERYNLAECPKCTRARGGSASNVAFHDMRYIVKTLCSSLCGAGCYAH